MAINKSEPLWTGDCPEDALEYLDTYSDHVVEKSKIVHCRECGGAVVTPYLNEEEEAIEVVCSACGAQRQLLDSGDYWEDCVLEKVKCHSCGNTRFNLAIGLELRHTGDVRWVYIAGRCEKCGVLDSVADWKISYSPTDELEKNI